MRVLGAELRDGAAAVVPQQKRAAPRPSRFRGASVDVLRERVEVDVQEEQRAGERAAGGAVHLRAPARRNEGGSDEGRVSARDF